MMPIRKSLIRLDSERRADADGVSQSKRQKWLAMLHAHVCCTYFCSRCRSVTLPLFCLFGDFSEQFVLTGKYHATLSALTPPPPRLSLSLSLSSSHFSSATPRVSFLPSFHILSCPFFPLLLYISSSLVRLGSTESTREHNVQHFRQ